MGSSGEVSVAEEETGNKERNQEFQKSSIRGRAVILDDESAHFFGLCFLVGSILSGCCTVLDVVALENSDLVLEE